MIYIQKMVMTGEKEEVQQIVDSMPSVPILNKAFRNKGNLKFSDEGMNWGFTQPLFPMALLMAIWIMMVILI